MTKNELKNISKLLFKKFRHESELFLIEGEKIVSEAVKSYYKIDKIFIENNSVDRFFEISQIAKQKNIEIELISSNDIEKICDSKTPQGIAALVYKHNQLLFTKGLITAVENVQDPGNVGTIIRNCDWFGCNQVLLSNDTVELYNPKLVRSSMGSLFHINVFSSNDFYADLISLQRNGYKLVCADLEGIDVKEINFSKKTVLVFCNESKGPSEKLMELNPAKVTIKKFGNAESLNVANASAVVLSEFAYRRL
jgi:TrmH family RNA methyltransferase